MGNCLCGQSSARDRENRRSNHRLERIPQLSGQVAAAPQLQGQQEPIQYVSNNGTHNPNRLRQFTYDELARAAASFSHGCIVGSGAFGEVYMGQIGDQTVAIKRLRYQASEQQEEEFMKEVRALRTVNHENLVKLIGFCSEGRNRLIVCEYCPKLSLSLHLHETDTLLPWGKSMNIAILTWERRMQIAIGSAKGLEYLHDYCQPKIIHRDIKTDNIVLDKDFKAKVVDFGLAKFFPESGSITHISSSIKGTKVYADPEYEPNQRVSNKSDVYSFGVVLLELISGRKPKANGASILDWAKPLIKNVVRDENEITELIDPKLRAIYNDREIQFHKKEMIILLFCAVASVYKPSRQRPQMRQIVRALETKILSDEIWEMNRDSVFLEPA